MQNKHWISSTLFVESFYMSPPVIKIFSTNLRESGGTTEKYVRSNSLKNFLLTAAPPSNFTVLTDTRQTLTSFLFANQGVVSQSMSGEIFY